MIIGIKLLDFLFICLFLFYFNFQNLFIMQVYRVSDMELVRVLPSAEDEVNVACFHPSVGGGLVYGTKVNK